MKKRFATLGVAALAVSFVLAACGSSDDSSTGSTSSSGSGSSSEPILIGGIAGTSGAYGSTGQAAFNGAQLAVDEINAAGGIDGRQVKFDGQDDGADATKASQLFDKYISDGAVAVVGSPDQGPTIAALADQKKFIAIGPVDDAGMSIYPNGPGTDPYAYAFSTSLHTFAWGEALGKWALANCSGLAVLHDPSGYGEGGLAGIKLAYDAAGKELALEESITENWSTGATVGLKAEIQKIEQAGADCVDVWLTPQDQASFVQEAATEGTDLTFLGNDETCADTTFSDLAKAQGDGMVCAFITTDLNPNDKVTKFREDYKAKFNVEATAFAELSYDGVYLLKAAIENGGGKTDPDSIKAELEKISGFEGLTGSLTFTPKQHHTITIDQLTVVTYDGAANKWVEAS